MGKKAASFNEWQSPVTSALLAGKPAALSEPTITPSGKVYWLQTTQPGKVVLATRVSSQGYNVTSPCHTQVNLQQYARQYGGVHAHPGTSYLIVGEDLYFVGQGDQCVYKQSLEEPAAGATLLTTRMTAKLKFSDLVWDGLRQRIVCVAEETESTSPSNSTISAIDVKTGAVSVLARGSNYYMSPTLDPTGTKLAWVQWNHPNMPWEGTELCVADVLNGGTVISAKVVAGGAEEAVQQPVWGLDGSLYFMSDKSGRWSLYKYMRRGETIPLLPEERDMGIVPWPLGRSSYYPLPTGKLLAIYRPSPSPSPSATEALGLLDPEKGEITPLDTGLGSFGASLAVRHIQFPGKWKIVVVAPCSTHGSKLVSLEVKSLDQLTSTTPADWQLLETASGAQAGTPVPNGRPTMQTPTTQVPLPGASTSQPPGSFPQFYPMMYVNPMMAAAYQAAYAAAFATATLQQRQNSQSGSSSSMPAGLAPAQSSPFAMFYPPGHPAHPANPPGPNNQPQQPQPMFAAYPYMAVAPYPMGFMPFGMPPNPFVGFNQFPMQVPPQQQQQQQQQGLPPFPGYQGFQAYAPQMRPGDPNRPNPRFMFPEGARYRRRVFSFRISLRSLLQFIVFGIIFYKNVLQHISWVRFTILLLGGMILFLTSHYAPLRRFISSLGNPAQPDPNRGQGQQPPQWRGILSELAVFVLGFVASLIPAWNYNAQDAAAFQAAQDMFADEDENRDNNNRNREQGGAAEAQQGEENNN